MPFRAKEISKVPVTGIFSINTGRAGSAYLANLLGTAQDVSAFHEPLPRMTGKTLRMVTKKSYESTFNRRLFKVRAIQSIVKESGKPVYAETSHMFIKTFFDVVVSGLENVRVVYLKRNLTDTLNSFMALGFFSEVNLVWKEWMISPYAVTAALPCPVKREEQDSTGMSIAYLFDIYARAERFRKEYPQVPVFETDIQQLNSMGVVEQLFSFLHLSLSPETERVAGKNTNSREERKNELARTKPDRDYLRQRILKYIQQLEASGVAVPPGITY